MITITFLLIIWFRFYINSDDDTCEGHKESTYEEAELACLRKLIEIVKQNQP